MSKVSGIGKNACAVVSYAKHTSAANDHMKPTTRRTFVKTASLGALSLGVMGCGQESKERQGSNDEENSQPRNAQWEE